MTTRRRRGVRIIYARVRNSRGQFDRCPKISETRNRFRSFTGDRETTLSFHISRRSGHAISIAIVFPKMAISAPGARTSLRICKRVGRAKTSVLPTVPDDGFYFSRFSSVRVKRHTCSSFVGNPKNFSRLFRRFRNENVHVSEHGAVAAAAAGGEGRKKNDDEKSNCRQSRPRYNIGPSRGTSPPRVSVFSVRSRLRQPTAQ